MNTTPDPIVIRQADLQNDADLAAVVRMIDDYAADPMGNGGRLAPEVLERVRCGLKSTPGAVAWLIEDGEQIAGGAVGFLGLSTFSGLSKLNIHDFSVNARHRGRGLGHRLMRAVLDAAAELGCEKVTLEVRADNEPAKAVYARAGFERGDTPWEFWTCQIGD